MDTEALIFGTGMLLREQIDAWATTDGGTPHVYPDYPPLDLEKVSYPRAAIDTIGADTTDQDVEGSAYFQDVLLEVTVYSTSSQLVNRLADHVNQAILDHHDGTDSSGEPYLKRWHLEQPEGLSNLLTEKADRGFTRYHKTRSFTFSTVSTTS